MKGSDLFVKALENEGVEYIFGVPGEENLDVIESIRQSNIQLIVTRHEQGAGFMAATYGRLTGKTGVCLSTLGPGATNMVTSAAYAQLGAMPILVITGQKPIKSGKQGRFQIINTIEMMNPITKLSQQIVDAHKIPATVREAIRTAQQERPGATHLELPEDIAREERDSPLFAIEPEVLPSADKAIIQKAAAMIEEASQPLILIGQGANRRETSQALEALINKTGIPFFNTQMGKGVIDERHPLFMGTAALSEGDYLHCAIDQADLIINVGHDIVEKPPFLMEQGGTKIIHINFSPAHIDEVYFPQLEVIGDITQSVLHLTNQINKQSSWDFTRYQTIKSAVEEHVNNGSDDPRFPLIPQRLVSDVRKAMPSDGILTLDNGIYKIWFARNYKAYQRHTLLLDNALASMGAGLPSAIGARFVFPNKKIVAICGDGGFMMNSQELETAVRYKLDLVVLILRDNGYGMIKWKQEAMGFNDFGLDFGNPDFVKYAESYGAKGHRIQNTDEFIPTLKKCLENHGVHVIEVPVDYSENSRVLIKELKEKTCNI